jgi:excisionase family DNA binding protein
MSDKIPQSAERVNDVRRATDIASESGSTGQGDSGRRTLSVEEAGRILGISRGSAYAYARNGSIPTIKLGKRLLVPRAALDRLLMGA